jgi:hypothetical protein
LINLKGDLTMENNRRFFLKQLFSSLAFTSCSALSFKLYSQTKSHIMMGITEPEAKTKSAGIKKIACEEHGLVGEAGLEKRLRDMDNAGIDMQVVGGDNPDDAKKYNDALAEIV